tara:strand:- start:1210 stop:1395 length:186 start_codon:yes stop_codon:yes gene_type:complete
MSLSIGGGEIPDHHRINSNHDQNQVVGFHQETLSSDSEASFSFDVSVDSEAICAHSGTVAL